MRSIPTQVDVLVVGAGPAGLTLATSLHARGVSCLLIDRLPAMLPWSRALGLQPRTQEILESLEVLEAIQAKSLVQNAIQVHGNAGSLFRLDLTTLEAPHPQLLSCPQMVVESVLEKRLTDLGGAVVRHCELLDFRQTGDAVVARLHWAEQEWSVKASILAGCDGAGSLVRRELGLHFDGVTYPDHFLLADVGPLAWDLDSHTGHAFLLPGGALIAIPMPGGWRLMVNQPSQEDLAPVPDLSLFRERLAMSLPEPPALGEPAWLGRFSVHRRLVSHYRRNRVFLVGDAAHVQTPLGAQGMNTAIADAFNLGWKLAWFLSGRGGGRLLDTYEEERRPVASRMLDDVDFLARSALVRNQLVRYARDGLYRLLGRRPQVARRLLRRAAQLDVHYRGAEMAQSVVFDLPVDRGAPVPGDRAPDVALTDADGVTTHTRLLLREGRAQLLVRVSGDVTHAERLSLYALADRVLDEYTELVAMHLVAPGPLPDGLAELGEYCVKVWHDDQGEMAQHYGAQVGLWLMRPDGHLGWCGAIADADRLVLWLGLWCEAASESR